MLVRKSGVECPQPIDLRSEVPLACGYRHLLDRTKSVGFRGSRSMNDAVQRAEFGARLIDDGPQLRAVAHVRARW